MDKIGIIGMGVVGKAIHYHYIRKISKIWIYDKYKNIGNLDNIAEHCRIIYVAVPTPYKKDIGYDLDELRGVLGELHTKLKRLRKMCVVFIKSTILPGTADDFAKRFPYLNIIYNPEFLSNSTAIEDFCNPKQIILGKTLISSNNVFKNIVKIHKRHWPDVFADIDIHTVPIAYLSSIKVEFKKGRVWEIDCNAKRSTGADLDKSISDLFREYGDDIVHVDFRLNTPKLKRDIEKRTRAFLKNPTKKKK